MLVSDTEGYIDQLFIVIPKDIFENSCKLSRSLRNSYTSLLSVLPDSINVEIYVSEKNQTNLLNLVPHIAVRENFNVHALPDNEIDGDDHWVRDHLHFYRGFSDLRARKPKLARKTRIEHWIEKKFPRAAIEPLDVYLDGGNQLVSGDFRIVGWSSVKTGICSSGGDIYCQLEKNIEIIDNLDRREVYYFYSIIEKISGAQSILFGNMECGSLEEVVGLLQARWEFDEYVQYLNQIPNLDRRPPSELSVEKVDQDGVHVDLFISVTGVKKNGKDVVLVADLVPVGNKKIANNPVFQELTIALDIFSKILEKFGFEVIRNMVPYKLDSVGSGEFRARYYNNVIVETLARPERCKPFVFVPCFGDEEEDLLEFDQQNLEIWTERGFEPIPLAGWGGLCGLFGAARCATNVSKRIVPAGTE